MLAVPHRVRRSNNVSRWLEANLPKRMTFQTVLAFLAGSARLDFRRLSQLGAGRAR